VRGQVNNQSNIKIIDFHRKYAEAFRDINYEWLNKYFEVEPYDEIVLGDPQKHIIDHGGHVLFALLDNKVIGTCALIHQTVTKYELTKLGVSGSAQGRGAGRVLMQAAIDKAKAIGAETLLLATSDKLEAANHLYRMFGFVETHISEIGPLPYKRKTFVMKLSLKLE